MKGGPAVLARFRDVVPPRAIALVIADRGEDGLLGAFSQPYTDHGRVAIELGPAPTASRPTTVLEPTSITVTVFEPGPVR